MVAFNSLCDGTDVKSMRIGQRICHFRLYPKNKGYNLKWQIEPMFLKIVLYLEKLTYELNGLCLGMEIGKVWVFGYLGYGSSRIRAYPNIKVVCWNYPIELSVGAAALGKER